MLEFPLEQAKAMYIPGCTYNCTRKMHNTGSPSGEKHTKTMKKVDRIKIEKMEKLEKRK